MTAADGLDGLMARLADGDRSAFAPVFRLLWPPTFALCRQLTGSETDGADAAQEAMKKILERSADYDAKRPALPWALAIAGWECRTLRRKQQRRREDPEHAVGETAHVDAESDILARDLAQAAVATLGQLTGRDRDTLTATFWGEAGGEPAVGDASGPTLRKRRERAIERLRITFRRLYGIDD